MALHLGGPSRATNTGLRDPLALLTEMVMPPCAMATVRAHVTAGDDGAGAVRSRRRAPGCPLDVDVAELGDHLDGFGSLARSALDLDRAAVQRARGAFAHGLLRPSAMRVACRSWCAQRQRYFALDREGRLDFVLDDGAVRMRPTVVTFSSPSCPSAAGPKSRRARAAPGRPRSAPSHRERGLINTAAQALALPIEETMMSSFEPLRAKGGMLA